MLGSLQVGRPFLQGRVSGRAQQCPLVANTHSHDEFQGGPVWGASSLPHLTSCLYSPSPHPRCRPWEDHHFTWSSQPPPDASRARAFDIYMLSLEGVPGLPGAPQDEAGLRRKFETSHV